MLIGTFVYLSTRFFMKILKRLVTFILALLVLFVGLAVVVPIVYKKEIVTLIKEDINNNVNAQVQFSEDVSISLLKSFPNLNIKISDVHITDSTLFKADTLLKCATIETTIALKPLLAGHQIDIAYVALDKPYVQLVTRQNSNNWDILKTESTDSNALHLSADFNNIQVDNGQLIYKDSSNTTHVDLNNITGSFKGNYADNIFDVKSDFICENAFVSYDHIPYVNHIPITTEAITSIDLISDTYAFKENLFTVGTLEVTASEGIQYDKDSVEIDIDYTSN